MTIDLTTKYLGLELRSPILVGSCPLTTMPEAVRQFVQAGAGAIVLPSLLQEQIINATKEGESSIAIDQGSGYHPQQDKYNGGVVNYLANLRELKSSFQLPVFASLNGSTEGNWLQFAKQLQDCGADALELNWQTSIASPEESADAVEMRFCKCIAKLRSMLTIPIAIKLSQRFTNIASIARKLHEAGADGVILFSHLPRWDVSIDRMHWTLRWELTPIDSVGEILEGIVRTRVGGLNLAIAASGGIRTGEDVMKVMIAGADVAMVTSEIYRHGPETIQKILAELVQNLESKKLPSIAAFKQLCPTPQSISQHRVRMELVDPLTSADRYFDPTPVDSIRSGDSFGHPHA
jgi:dihydroorotate dehydrogenase (fumarate)